MNQSAAGTVVGPVSAQRKAQALLYLSLSKLLFSQYSKKQVPCKAGGGGRGQLVFHGLLYGWVMELYLELDASIAHLRKLLEGLKES